MTRIIHTNQRSKQTKWKSAEHKRRDEELKASWETIGSKHSTIAKGTGTPRKAGAIGTKYTLGTPPGRSGTKHIPSIVDTVAVAVKKDVPVYSGTECIGIAVMHKSSLQPVFNEQAAKDSASMRR